MYGWSHEWGNNWINYNCKAMKMATTEITIAMQIKVQYIVFAKTNILDYKSMSLYVDIFHIYGIIIERFKNQVKSFMTVQ